MKEIEEVKNSTIVEEQESTKKVYTRDDFDFPDDYIFFDSKGNKMTIDEFIEYLNSK